MKLTKRLAILLLVIIIIFHLINNYWIIKNNKQPLFGEDVQTFRGSLIVYSHLGKGNFRGIIPFSNNYPILLLILPSVLYPFLGTHHYIPPLVNIPFLIILVFSVYGIGKEMHSKRAGLLAAFTVTVFPHVFGLSRVYYYDFPLMCFVTLTIYLLIKTEHFISFKYSIIFGLSLAISAILKPTFSIFLICPILIYLFYSIKNKPNLYLQVKNVTLVLFLFLIIFIPFYISGWNNFVEHAKISVDPPEFTHEMSRLDIFTSNLRYYFTGLAGYQLLYLYFLLFVLATIFSLFFFKRNILLLSWIFIPYFFFSLLTKNNALRYILPVLPAIAIMISLFIFNLKNKLIKIVFILLILCTGIFQFIFISYCPNYHHLLGKMNERLNLVFDQVFIYQYGINALNPNEMWSYGLLYSNPNDLGLYNIVQTIDKYEDKYKTENIIIFTRNFYFPLQYLFELSNMTVNLAVPDYNTLNGFENYDYIIKSNLDYKEGSAFQNNFINSYFHNVFYNLSSFYLISNITYPEDVSMLIYKREAS